MQIFFLSLRQINRSNKSNAFVCHVLELLLQFAELQKTTGETSDRQSFVWMQKKKEEDCVGQRLLLLLLVGRRKAGKNKIKKSKSGRKIGARVNVATKFARIKQRQLRHEWPEWPSNGARERKCVCVYELKRSKRGKVRPDSLFLWIGNERLEAAEFITRFGVAVGSTVVEASDVQALH